MHLQFPAREIATEKDNRKAEAAQISGGRNAATAESSKPGQKLGPATPTDEPTLLSLKTHKTPKPFRLCQLKGCAGRVDPLRLL